jgi:hypothetical protein
MKNKVINLFDKPHVIVKNEGVKYSSLFEKFLEPFIDEFDDVEFHEDVFEFAINAWNFANMKVLLPADQSDEAINSVPGEVMDLVLLNKMIDYKILKFKEYTNFIVDFELKETSGDPILSLTTQAEEQYLTSMMNVLEEETEENDFRENDFDEGYINRHAIIIIPRQPFLDWYTNLFPEDVNDINFTNTYLINEDIQDFDSWFKSKYEKIFIHQLEVWTPNKKQWPQKRNYKMFKEWFNIDRSVMVYDFEKRPVSKL